jgi:hypothetical protein
MLAHRSPRRASVPRLAQPITDFVRLGRRARLALADPRRAWRELLIARDWIAFRRQTKPLRNATATGSGQPTTLIVSLSGFIYQLKVEGVLGSALKLAGSRVVVLTHAGWTWPKRYFRSFGIDEFVYLEDYLGTVSEDHVQAAVEQALAGGVGVQLLRKVVFRGAHVGEQALSTLSRRYFRGRISLSDPTVRANLEEILAESIRSVLAGERLLDEIDPGVVIFNEKGYAGFGSIYDLALSRDANVIQFVSAGIHWRDALVFRRFTEETRRVHPTSLSPESWTKVRMLTWTNDRERELADEFRIRYGGGEMHPDAGLQAGKLMKSPDEIRADLGLDDSKKTAVVFSHVLWDANMFYGDDLFEDQETWLVETVKAAAANPRVNWIVKLHPANAYKSHSTDELNDEVAIREAVGELPPHVTLLRPETEINTYSLFELADAGVTIRGTVGMELPCFGVPVLTAGTGRYSGMGFTIDSATRDEYLARLARIEEIAPLSEEQVLLAKRHAYGLFRLRPFRFSSYRAHFMPAERLEHPLSHNLELTLRTAAETESAEDLREFAAWALDSRSLDYLTEPT